MIIHETTTYEPFLEGYVCASNFSGYVDGNYDKRNHFSVIIQSFDVM